MAQRTSCVCENSLQQSIIHTRACPEHVCKGNYLRWHREQVVPTKGESEALAEKTVKTLWDSRRDRNEEKTQEKESGCKREREERKENEKRIEGMMIPVITPLIRNCNGPC